MLLAGVCCSQDAGGGIYCSLLHSAASSSDPFCVSTARYGSIRMFYFLTACPFQYILLWTCLCVFLSLPSAVYFRALICCLSSLMSHFLFTGKMAFCLLLLTHHEAAQIREFNRKQLSFSYHHKLLHSQILSKLTGYHIIMKLLQNKWALASQLGFDWHC